MGCRHWSRAIGFNRLLRVIRRISEWRHCISRGGFFLGSVSTLFTLAGMIFYQLGSFLVSVLVAQDFGIEMLGSYHYFVSVTTFIALLSKHGVDEEAVYTAELHGGLKSAVGQDFIRKTLGLTLLYSVMASLFFLVVDFLIVKLFGMSGREIMSPLIIVSTSVFVFHSILCSILRSESMFVARAFFSYVVPLVMLFSIYFAITLSHGRSSAFVEEIRVVATNFGSFFSPISLFAGSLFCLGFQLSRARQMSRACLG